MLLVEGTTSRKIYVFRTVPINGVIKLKYRIYGHSYLNGWELIDVILHENEIDEILNNINKNEYGHFIVIKQTEYDEIYKSGYFEKPKNKIKKL